MAKQTLVEKARAIEGGRRAPQTISDEEIELVIAWALDEVTLTQAAKAAGYKTPGAYVSRAALIFREAIRCGFLKPTDGRRK